MLIKFITTRLGLFIILFLSCTNFVHAGEEHNEKNRVTLKNDSVFTYRFQVKDDICPTFLKSECRRAKLMLNSKECAEQPDKKSCQLAADQWENNSCMAGLVFDGVAEGYQEINLSLCKAPSGYSVISVRTKRKFSEVSEGNATPWKQYRLLENGDFITYP